MGKDRSAHRGLNFSQLEKAHEELDQYGMIIENDNFIIDQALENLIYALVFIYSPIDSFNNGNKLVSYIRGQVLKGFSFLLER